MKTLRVLLRRTLAIALLSLPTEALLDENKRIALTFDDGPAPGATEALLDELDRLQIKATLFPVGGEVEKFPEQTRATIDAGHSLGNPTDSHTNLVEIGTEKARGEIAGAAKILRELGCDEIPMFRPPFGLLPEPLEQELASQDTQVSRWDLLPEASADMNDLQAVADYIAENAFPGAVVLLHPVYGQREQVLKSLPLISERLRAEGYSFSTLSELLHEPPDPSA